MNKINETQQKIPLSQVVHVDIDDEVSTIYEKLAKKKFDLVYLVVPYRAVLFQSIVNLKILKRKAKDIGKEIALITKDKSGVFFANKCYLKVYDNAGTTKKRLTSENIPDDFLTEADNNKSQFETVAPIKTSNKRTTITELLKKIHYQTMFESIQKFFYKLSRKKSRQQYAKKLLMSNPNRTLLVSLILASLVLLTLITYIALPNATVVLKANSVPVERAVNITLADVNKNAGLLRTRPNRTIASYNITPGMVETVITFDATGNDLDGENARGVLEVSNHLAREFPLVNFTRFQTEDGMIFRTQHFSIIPGGSPDNPAKIQIEVVADPIDVNGIPIGEKGNIQEGVRLFIPGLNFVPKEQLYGVVKTPFQGGLTSKNKIVTERDIQSAKEFVMAEMQKQAPTKLQEYLVKFNAERNLNLSLINDPQTIYVSEIQTIVDENIVGQKMNNFTVAARAGVSGTAYDHTEFIQILKNEVALRKTPDKNLLQIDENGAVIRILKINNEVGLIEITATIQAIEKYEINSRTEEGQKLVNKIKERIAGKEVTEAKKLIESLPEVESVKITTWPFWAPTVPGRLESINIEINDQN